MVPLTRFRCASMILTRTRSIRTFLSRVCFAVLFIPFRKPHVPPVPSNFLLLNWFWRLYVVLSSFSRPNSLNLSVAGTSIRYLETVHHRASLEDLSPGTRIYYRCSRDNKQKSSAAEKQRHVPDLNMTVAVRREGVAPPETRREDGYGSWSALSSFMTAPDPNR